MNFKQIWRNSTQLKCTSAGKWPVLMLTECFVRNCIESTLTMCTSLIFPFAHEYVWCHQVFVSTTEPSFYGESYHAYNSSQPAYLQMAVEQHCAQANKLPHSAGNDLKSPLAALETLTSSNQAFYYRWSPSYSLVHIQHPPCLVSWSIFMIYTRFFLLRLYHMCMFWKWP